MTENNNVTHKTLSATPIESISFQLANLKLSALACGDPNHKVVLCLHGYLDNAASFLPLLKESDLLADSYLIALDFPGHGHSEHRGAGAHYHFLDYVHDLAELFSTYHWQAIDIIGHSMGAMVASAFAAAFPEYVKSLILIDSFGFINAPESEATNQLRKGIQSRLTTTNQSIRGFSRTSAIKARMRVSDLSVECAELIIRRATIKSDVSSPVDDDEQVYCWRSDTRLRSVSPYRFSLKQGQQLYKDIKCPVKLIYGEQGLPMVKAGMLDYAPCVTNLNISALPGGHHVHMENPNSLLSIVKKFYLTL